MTNGYVGILVMAAAIFGFALDIKFDQTVTMGNMITLLMLIVAFIYSWVGLAVGQKEVEKWREVLEVRLRVMEKEQGDERERLAALAVGVQALGARVGELELRR